MRFARGRAGAFGRGMPVRARAVGLAGLLAVTTTLPAGAADRTAAAGEPAGTSADPGLSSRETGERFDLAAHEAEIPAFARKYKVSCSVCHAPFPRLNEFGETFAGNGFEFAPGEPPRDTVDTGDPLLRIMRDLPLAMRFDGFVVGRTDTFGEQVSSDIAFPWGIKLLSGGQIADKVSYYFYFFMSERGEIAGLEDAYIQFTDVGGSGLGVLAGQFQVSDPLFKRELRLEFEDYQPYRVRVGDARADLTYDRGFMATLSPWEGGDLVAGVVNGQGLSEGNEARQLDRDGSKNFFLRASHDFGPVRIGGFGFYGRETADDVDDDTWIWGPDLTLPIAGVAELNLQYLRREDDNPFFSAAPEPEEVAVDAALAELLWWPDGIGGRWVLNALYNWIEADEEVFTLRTGEQTESGFLRRYRSAAVGFTWVGRRNLRLLGEVAWDLDNDQARITTGVVTAF